MPCHRHCEEFVFANGTVVVVVVDDVVEAFLLPPVAAIDA
jgi:hypothetical protein